MIKNIKLFLKHNEQSKNNGFGLVDAILSLTLLAGIVTYGVYFSSLRFSTVHSSNLIRSINKEIERDIERLKLDLWRLYYDSKDKKYIISQNECANLSESIINVPSWETDQNNPDQFIQSWSPGIERGKVFSGNNVKITRELSTNNPMQNSKLNNSIATLDYKVEWGGNNEHWLSIELGAEAHSWCEQII